MTPDPSPSLATTTGGSTDLWAWLLANVHVSDLLSLGALIVAIWALYKNPQPRLKCDWQATAYWHGAAKFLVTQAVIHNVSSVTAFNVTVSTNNGSPEEWARAIKLEPGARMDFMVPLQPVERTEDEWYPGMLDFTPTGDDTKVVDPVLTVRWEGKRLAKKYRRKEKYSIPVNPVR